MTEAPSIALLQDFPDRLSPMVVKELRQSLRRRVFAGLLLLLHSLLAIQVMMSAGAENAERITSLMDGLITLVLCVVLPLLGFSALAGEIKNNTLDTLVLTRLSAGRIVFGKWASIALLISLVALSIMPYVVARYVFGGLNLVTELGWHGMKWIIGLVIAAAIVCLSTQKLGLRAAVIGLPLVAVVFSGLTTFMMVYSGFGGTSFSAFSRGPGLVFNTGTIALIAIVFAAAGWLIFSFLSIAATRIAPPASNSAVWKRSVHLLAILLLAGIGWLTSGAATAAQVMSMVAAIAALDALTERENGVPSVYAAFDHRGLAGRLSSWLLAPGWNTGILFSLALAAMTTAFAWVRAGDDVATKAWLASAGVWMPAALVQISSARRSRDLLGPWIVCWLIGMVFGMLISMTSSVWVMKKATPWLSCVLPSTLQAGLAVAQPGDKETLRFWGLAASALWPMILLIAAVFAFRRTRSARLEARRMALSETA